MEGSAPLKLTTVSFVTDDGRKSADWSNFATRCNHRHIINPNDG